MAQTLPKPPKTVDLHAEAFLDNLDVYETNELLAESLELMREMLDAAIYWDYTEIRFIHGRGRGILRKAVYEELTHYRESAAIASYHPSYHNEDIVVVNIGL